tara:strand:- start:3418 stop:3693 length:276 start_codon:yes stop_codon:yes gene_type:complete
MEFINVDIPALFEWEIPISREYRPFFFDLSRILTIHLLAHIFLVTSSQGQYKFFSAEFLKTFLFIILGVMIYWLIFKKLVRFKFKDDQSSE